MKMKVVLILLAIASQSNASTLIGFGSTALVGEVAAVGPPLDVPGSSYPDSVDSVDQVVAASGDVRDGYLDVSTFGNADLGTTVSLQIGPYLCVLNGYTTDCDFSPTGELGDGGIWRLPFTLGAPFEVTATAFVPGAEHDSGAEMAFGISTEDGSILDVAAVASSTPEPSSLTLVVCCLLIGSLRAWSTFRGKKVG